ncbi:hypothetical protein [Sulfitobacter sp. S190]|uniref:hypothetical protein n=1 Tax=Sulfitobacter sp. S190 TaxID=2867022 RepID=UPI0021A3A0C3|nr:hypothetical protein [Sulfitobacter sp. S190]UWR23644.1 hypothetical protein K3756_06660 [Sulfitobacter sp. S190]
MTLPYTYQSHGRQPTTIAVVLAIWAALLAAWYFLDAALWIIGVIAAFTAPAVYDIAANPVARFSLSHSHLVWQADRSDADIDNRQIDHLRLDTRLDLSIRLSVVLPNGRKLRVPQPATPPPRELEQAAALAGLTLKRHHFSLMG